MCLRKITAAGEDSLNVHEQMEYVPYLRSKAVISGMLSTSGGLGSCRVFVLRGFAEPW